MAQMPAPVDAAAAQYPNIDMTDGRSVVRSMVAWHLQTRSDKTLQLTMMPVARRMLMDELRRLQKQDAFLVDQEARIRRQFEEVNTAIEAAQQSAKRVLDGAVANLWLSIGLGLASAVFGFSLGMLVP